MLAQMQEKMDRLTRQQVYLEDYEQVRYWVKCVVDSYKQNKRDLKAFRESIHPNLYKQLEVAPRPIQHAFNAISGSYIGQIGSDYLATWEDNRNQKHWHLLETWSK